VLHEDLTVGRNSAWQQYVASGHFDIDDSDPAHPTIALNRQSKYTRQYFHYIRAGALRIGATSDDAQLDPVAFVNRDGGFVVVVEADRGDDLSVVGLGAGTYGASYTVSDIQWGVELPETVVGVGGTLEVTMPAPGVLTIYGKEMSWLLRNDSITSIRPTTPDLAAVFTGQGPASLDVVGSDGVPTAGEGAAPDLPGSDDDDDAYIEGFISGGIDPDPAGLTDPARPLILYQVTRPTGSLRVIRERPSTIRVFF